MATSGAGCARKGEASPAEVAKGSGASKWRLLQGASSLRSMTVKLAGVTRELVFLLEQPIRHSQLPWPNPSRFPYVGVALTS